MGKVLKMKKNSPEIIAFRNAALACSINPRIVDDMVKRLVPVSKDKSYTDKELLEQLKSKQSMAVDHMDAFSFANASLKELGIYFGIVTDKRLLLEGKATQIMTVEDRRSMQEMLPILLKEAQRRGLTIDMEPIQEGE